MMSRVHVFIVDALYLAPHAVSKGSCGASGMQAALGCMMALGQELQQAAAAVLTARQRTAVAPRCHRGTRLEVEVTHRRCLEAMHRLPRQIPAQPPQMLIPQMHLLLRRIHLQLALR